MSIQKGISDFSFIIGTGLMYSGATSLLAMAIIGTVSIDLVILSAVTNSNKEHRNHHHHGSNNNQFLTGYILGSMFSNQHPSDPVPLLIISPITSLIAIGLSVALGVPYIGVAIAAGWALAITMFAVGHALIALSEAIDPDPQYTKAYPIPTAYPIPIV